MTRKIPDAAPLTGTETAIVIQDGKAVKTTVQDIVNRVPTVKGAKGDTGPAGPAGPKGDAGPQGTTGLTGSAGAKGDVGPQGLQGPKGDTGPQGNKGDQGLQGLKGDTGAQGAKGDQGMQGATGATGATGAKGDTGAAGPAGTPKRIERFTGTTNSSGIAAVAFSPAFSSVPDIDVIEAWSGEQMITGAVVAGSATVSGCQVQVMVSRATLLLSSGPFQKAGSGVSITVKATGN